MAATGSGPSRRSHTKSRRGCKTCKRRHVRCDESFPQCNNCTKHQVRCDYQDSSQTPENQPESPGPELGWSAEVDAVLGEWQMSGRCNLGRFSIDLQGNSYSRNDLYLIYHCLTYANAAEGSDLTIWTTKLPRFLELAPAWPFLMHAILAFGALCLGWEQRSTDAKNLAYYHGGEALKQLQNAINNFSRENSEAVFAASILMSWQANDWKSWSSLVAGIRSVINGIHTWQSQTSLADIVAEQESTIPTSFPVVAQPQVTEESRRQYYKTLSHIHRCLEGLQPYLFGRDMETQFIEQLKDYIQRLLGVRQAHSPEEQFNHLYALRKWILWVPAYLLKTGQKDFLTLTMISYFYATALQFDPLYPNVAAAFCAAPVFNPFETVLKELARIEAQSNGQAEYFENNSQLLSFPRTAMAFYRSRQLELQAAEQMSPLDLNNFTSSTGWAMEAYQPTGQLSPGFPLSTQSRSPTNTSSPSSNFLDMSGSVGEGISPWSLSGELDEQYQFDPMFQSFSTGPPAGS